MLDRLGGETILSCADTDVSPCGQHHVRNSAAAEDVVADSRCALGVLAVVEHDDELGHHGLTGNSSNRRLEMRRRREREHGCDDGRCAPVVLHGARA